MIIEINYTALQWDNYQGGSGKPYEGRMLIDVNPDQTLQETMNYVEDVLHEKSKETKHVIGNYILKNIIVDAE